ncbi:MAG: MFS transporter [Actinomycetota bacterium]
MLSRRRLADVMVTTSGAMTASTFQLFLIAVLAATLIDELGLNRLQIGILGAVNTGVGAVLAPQLGRLADRLGTKRAMVGLLASSGVGLLGTAAAPGFVGLVAASFVSGFGQGAGNPVTNKLIAEQVPLSQQNPVMGVKQSGVQFAVFLAGATMPASAASFGWRWAVAVSGVLSLGAAVVVAVRQPLPTVPLPAAGGGSPWMAGTDGADGVSAAEVDEARAAAERAEARRYVRCITLYALLMGLCAGGVTRFYPLFAVEVLGYSEARAGLAVSVAGATAVVTRVVWAQVVNGRLGLDPALVAMALGAVATVACLYLAESGAAWLLWPAVLGVAATVVAWNVVAMLAVIRTVPREEAGGATGLVLLGFLGGLTVSAPLVGYSVDVFDSYRPAWVALALTALASAVVVLGRRPSTGGEPVPVPTPEPRTS